MWFLYYVNSKICVYTITISHEEIVSSWDGKRNSSALSFLAKFKFVQTSDVLLIMTCLLPGLLLIFSHSFESFCTLCCRKHRKLLMIKERSVIIASLVISTVPGNSVESLQQSLFVLRKQSAVTTWHNWQKRRRTCALCGQLNKYSTLLALSCRIPYPQNISSYF